MPFSNSKRAKFAQVSQFFDVKAAVDEEESESGSNSKNKSSFIADDLADAVLPHAPLLLWEDFEGEGESAVSLHDLAQDIQRRHSSHHGDEESPFTSSSEDVMIWRVQVVISLFILYAPLFLLP
jgi:hypothetical protein